MHSAVNSVEEVSRQRASFLKPVSYACLLLIVIFFAAIRYRLAGMPLERDEGEYAYAGQLLLQHIPPYQLAYNMKFPGTYIGYAVILLFGQTVTAIHVALILVNALTIWLIFLLGKNLLEKHLPEHRASGFRVGIISAATYALLSTSESVSGFAAHATNFVVLPALAGIWLFLKAEQQDRRWLYFASGLALGLAFLMKQPGIVFSAFVIVGFLRSAIQQRSPARELLVRGALLGAGMLLPFFAVCIWLWRAGVFPQFYFWTFQYAREYATGMSASGAWLAFKMHVPEVVGPSFLMWLLAAAGLTVFAWDRKRTPVVAFLSTLLLLSFLGVSAGFYFRDHYFILLLPAVALLVGIAVDASIERLSQPQFGKLAPWLPVVFFVIALGVSIFQQRVFYFQASPLIATRIAYGSNPFPEALDIAAYIEGHGSPEARIAVLGSEPEIYFYAHRHSATGFIYMYGLMERQKYALSMQKQCAGEIENARPEFLVFVNTPVSWLPLPGSELFIFGWMEKYVRAHYQLVGIADLADPTLYRWGPDAESYRPHSRNTIFVFKRKP